MVMGLPSFQYEEICKIDGPLTPLWVKIRPSSNEILSMATDAFIEMPARFLQNSNVSFLKVSGTRAGNKFVIFKLNCFAIR